MELIHQENRIYAENDAGKVIAEVTFPQENDSTVCLDHTFVDDSLRGQGVAGKLVKEVVAYAQKHTLIEFLFFAILAAFVVTFTN